jgi:glyoxylase-like metal-dependent hydrolase (beta-lactamase superfamily II)
MSENALRKWQVGDVTITKIVESHAAVDIANVFPTATTAALLAIPWLQPHFATPDGRAIFSMHALVVETPTKRIIVDTCVGNDRTRPGREFFSNQKSSFLQNLAAAGFARETFDLVLCTHLHWDHVGWNTMLVDGKWVPTFPKARYLLNKTEYDHWNEASHGSSEASWDAVQRISFIDSVKPVFDAGLVDVVDEKHKVCNEVSLVPTIGHSPGHVSVRISSRGEEALITGDMAHHPSQLAHLDWGVSFDFDRDQAIKTRTQVFSDVAEKPILVIGTHWAGATAGWVKRSGSAFRLET